MRIFLALLFAHTLALSLACTPKGPSASPQDDATTAPDAELDKACAARGALYVDCPPCPKGAVCEPCERAGCQCAAGVWLRSGETCRWNPNARTDAARAVSCKTSGGVFRRCPPCPEGAMCKPCQECSCPEGREPPANAECAATGG
jgi:hypothetical protein